MNLFLLFASTLICFNLAEAQAHEWQMGSRSDPSRSTPPGPPGLRSNPAAGPASSAAGHELRIEDLQKPTRMKNGIVLVPIDNSNEDIISLERSVIRFLINNHYIVEDFIYQWERLKRRHLLTQDAQNKILINEATIYKAIKKYQEDNDLTQTGIIDMNILKKVFGNEYNGRSMVDAGGVYFLENVKTYGEDDPSIGKALRFTDSLTSSGAPHDSRRKKRSVRLNELRMLGENELRMLGENESDAYEKKSNDL